LNLLKFIHQTDNSFLQAPVVSGGAKAANRQLKSQYAGKSSFANKVDFFFDVLLSYQKEFRILISKIKIIMFHKN